MFAFIFITAMTTVLLFFFLLPCSVRCEGDRFHLAYVALALKPPMEIHHQAVGTTFSFNQPGRHSEDAVIAAARDGILKRFVPVLKTQMVPYEMHLFADRRDATPERVGETILKCAAEHDAALVVMAAHNKPHRDRFEGELGGVAKYITNKCMRPLAVVHPKFSGEEDS